MNNNNGKGVYRGAIAVIAALAGLIICLFTFENRVDARIKTVEELHRADMKKVERIAETLPRIEERLIFIQDKIDKCRCR